MQRSSFARFPLDNLSTSGGLNEKNKIVLARGARLNLRIDAAHPEDNPNEAVWIPRPLPGGPVRPGCLPIRLFMMMQLIECAPHFNII